MLYNMNIILTRTVCSSSMCCWNGKSDAGQQQQVPIAWQNYQHTPKSWQAIISHISKWLQSAFALQFIILFFEVWNRFTGPCSWCPCPCHVFAKSARVNIWDVLRFRVQKYIAFIECQVLTAIRAALVHMLLVLLGKRQTGEASLACLYLLQQLRNPCSHIIPGHALLHTCVSSCQHDGLLLHIFGT